MIKEVLQIKTFDRCYSKRL